MKESSLEVSDPIMIGGCGSSGTTLLSHLLNASSTIHCGPELYLLNKKTMYERPFQYTANEFREVLSQGVPTVGVLCLDFLSMSTCSKPRRDLQFIRNPGDYGFGVDALCELAARSDTFKKFVDGFFRIVLTRFGKSRWAEKTPRNCYCIGEFLSMYPAGKYIHVVRDGRDVAISLSKRGGFSPEEAVRRWIHDTAIGLPHRDNSRYYEVVYEKLVAEPQNTLAGVMKFLEEKERSNVLTERAKTQPVLEKTHATWGLQPDEAISARSVGKWKQADFAQDKHYLECLFHRTTLAEEVAYRLGLRKSYSGNDLLLDLGYDLHDSWTPVPRCGRKILKHFIRETLCEILHSRRLYCRISLR